MQAAIGYLRVSTREQGRSGLGLAAQRFEIEAFGSREGFVVRSWHQDVQTGAGADALLLRPGLAKALKEAKSARCPLIVSSCVRGRTMFNKRESDTIQQVALDMDGLTTKDIFRALIACYREGYRHAEDDYNEASLELNGSEGTLDRPE